MIENAILNATDKRMNTFESVLFQDLSALEQINSIISSSGLTKEKALIEAFSAWHLKDEDLIAKAIRYRRYMSDNNKSAAEVADIFGVEKGMFSKLVNTIFYIPNYTSIKELYAGGCRDIVLLSVLVNIAKKSEIAADKIISFCSKNECLTRAFILKANKINFKDLKQIERDLTDLLSSGLYANVKPKAHIRKTSGKASTQQCESTSEQNKVKGVLSKAECAQRAKGYSTRSEFKSKDYPAFSAAKRNGWLNECCAHMTSIYRLWTLEKCKEKARLYSKRSEFQRWDAPAYNAAQKNGWLDECCAHMEIMNRTWTLEDCKKLAKTYTTRGEFCKSEPLAYGAAFSHGWLDECCTHMKPPKRSSDRKEWTKEECKKRAKPYSKRSEFKRLDSPAYNAARRNGWLDDCCAHMRIMNRVWTLEECKKRAEPFSTRTEFLTNESAAYDGAVRNGWLDECCSHMKVMCKSWTFDECKEKARIYSTRSEFCKKESKAYRAALTNGWLDECCSHMKCGRKKWSLEACKEKAQPYSTRTEFYQKESKAYGAARKHGWLDDCCAHMKQLKKSWTIEECIAKAKPYSTRVDFQKNEPKAYGAAQRKGWLDECCAHMTRKH